jgi:ethanolamine utilization protein EutA
MRHCGMQSLPLAAADNTVRATVIGAGSWTLSLSGATVWAEHDILPLRNLPVITVPVSDWEEQGSYLSGLLRKRCELYDLETDRQPFIFAFAHMPPSCKTLSLLARALADFWQPINAPHIPVIVALREDLGKALGMMLRPLLPGRKIIVVDEIKLSDGDYLDLARPLPSLSAIPLVIKSLAFPN